MKYKEYKQTISQLGTQVNQDILAFWKANKVFEQSITSREGKPTFTFYEGPPSANGTPGIHHVMARTIKDIFCRYQTLKGKQVKRKGGWDTHGLPIELQVEKELGITKEDIGKKISVADYNKKCRETVMKYKDQWDNLTELMGYWVDLDNPYITFENNYIESCWWLLKQLYDKGLLYEGYTIQPYSPAAGTGLSSHELNQPGTYRMVKDTTIIAQFKIKGTQNDYFLAWTTTPWTLPANSALAVGKDIDYVKVKTHNQYTNQPVNVIMAKSLMNKVLGNKYVNRNDTEEEKFAGKIPFVVAEEMKGQELLGIAYEQLIPFAQPLENEENAFKVIAGDFVTTEDGTGIVHISPTFGADDFRAAKDAGVPPIMVLDEDGKEMPLVDKQGRFVKTVKEKFDEFFDNSELKNKYFKPTYIKPEYEEAESQKEGYMISDVLISIMLKEQNRAFKVEKYEHTYPHCWRTDKPVLYYPLESWFIKTTALKDRLVELNNTINWKPESTGTGRFGNWLENLVDWNLSRSRFWGTPLPVWKSEDGKKEVCIGSIAELIKAGFLTKEKANEYFDFEKVKVVSEDTNNGSKGVVIPMSSTGLYISLQEIQQYVPDLAQKLDLHKPFADDVLLIQEGIILKRVSDLIDVWFDSGAMPYAQWHYPFENQDIFKENYPADYISEGVDQTRGWFFTLHAIAGLVFDSVAFKNVVSTGLVLDKDGEKMSKRKGNVINPFEAIEKYGVDAIRWYMVENSDPWDNLKFNLGGVEELQRKFFSTLQNTYNFFAMYANVDGYEIDEFNAMPYGQRATLDRWIISVLQNLIETVDSAYADYDVTKAVRAIQDFVCDQLSNWYVRLSRKRFWIGEMTADKQAAYQTLHECLLVTAQLMSPVAPFFAEWLYKNMTDGIREKAKAKNTPLQYDSVHLTYFTTSSKNLIDKDLEQSMTLAQSVCSLVHSIRKDKKLKVRQPLQKILVPVLDEATKAQIEAVKDLIKTEVNIKEITYISDDSGILTKKIKPNFRELGKIYGKQMQAIAAEITKMSQADINQLEKEGEFVVHASGTANKLTLKDVEISSEDIAGWSVAKDGNITVALDITVTEELREEGIARDLVNRIQNIRKDKGLEVQDKIKVFIQEGDKAVDTAIRKHAAYISGETQATVLELLPQVAQGEELEIDDWKVRLEVAVN
jgi:isoleucyl-tRNA synthetase